MTSSNFLELKIVSTAYGGKGIARHDGKVMFVEGAVEGDTVLAEIIEQTDRYGNAEVRQILQPSPIRGSSPCAFSQSCGGCQWQEISYPQQLIWKNEFVNSAMKRIGKLQDIDCEIIASETVQSYRNRILLRARILTDGSVVVGYFQRASRTFVPITSCMIAAESINLMIGLLTKTKLTKNPTEEVKFRFEVQELPFLLGQGAHLLVSVHEPEGADIKIQELITLFQRLPGVVWAGSVRDAAKAPFFKFEEDLGVSFHTSPGLFQQVNVALNRTLRRMVLQAAMELKSKSVLDLYCGSGNLSLPLAVQGLTVQGVEFSPKAIECAKFNCKINKVTSAEYTAQDTVKFLKQARRPHSPFDLVIADPPRDGMYKSLVSLIELAPRHIIYVSCDPTTLARDLAVLCKSDYRVHTLKALDFFPGSYHVESFVILEHLK